MEIITSVSDGPTQRGAGEDQVLLGRHRRSEAPTRRNPALQRYVTLISELAQLLQLLLGVIVILIIIIITASSRDAHQ